MMKEKSLLLIDALINIILGGLLLFAPESVADFLGVPPVIPRFYPGMLGAILIGIGLALLIEVARFVRVTGLGLGGALAINLSGGIGLAVLLIIGDLTLPMRGWAFLWGLVLLLVVISGAELVAYINRHRKISITHTAMWTHDIKRLRDFYYFWFDAEFSKRYSNPETGFQSYFLYFEEGPRLEIMSAPDVAHNSPRKQIGLAHIAISVGSKEEVTSLTIRMSAAGIKVVSDPRTTGDGYFESVILDPDGNHVEITV